MIFSLAEGCDLISSGPFMCFPKVLQEASGMTGTQQQLQCLTLLRDCKSLNHLKQACAFVSKAGLDADPLIAGKAILLSAVTLTGSLDYACHLFSHFPSPDAFMHNTLIRGLSESEHPLRSIFVFNQMRQRCILPDSFSFAFLVKAAANIKSLCAGCQFHSLSIHHGLDTHLFVGTTLISMYAECGFASHAKKVFEGLPQPNIVAWNAVVTACFRSHDAEGAEALFSLMPWRNLTSWNIMLAGYTKDGELESARRLFFEMPHRDQVSWSTMIVGFASSGRFEDARSFFRDLLREGQKPSEVSLSTVLSACAQSGAFEAGKILHGHIISGGSIGIVVVTNALLDMYSRCGNIEMARQVFEQDMVKKNIVSWTSMIAAFAMHGHGEAAVKFFNNMENFGINPDGVSLVSVLYACSHSGLIEQGHEFFQRMEDAYGITPSIEHYGCMVDLYGRAGLLEKAYQFAKEMPIEPNAIIWRTLLGACSVHGDVKLAELVKQQLSELDPNDSSDYVLLSNIYAVAGKWKDVAEVRRSMSRQAMKKNPGWSLIEVDKVIYRFLATDESSQVGEEANKKLAEVMTRLRGEGYVPEVASVLHDIEAEEKEGAIVRHSEKLALAFGMARISEERNIRIVKNLRVCRDCHTVMKLVSKVYRRMIVVRDRSRFHAFREGVCSCRDYW